jgi:hypothetical protein
MTETNDASTRGSGPTAYFTGAIEFTWLFWVTRVLQLAKEEAL